jgi:crossover junction endodeoxyribonuclease RusA
MLAKMAKLSMPAPRAMLILTFCPPDRRRRDDDNLVAAFKSGRDGLAEALGIDDAALSLQVHIGDTVKGGAVHAVLRAINQSARLDGAQVEDAA